jgi:hypothetical protein
MKLNGSQGATCLGRLGSPVLTCPVGFHLAGKFLFVCAERCLRSTSAQDDPSIGGDWYFPFVNLCI